MCNTNVKPNRDFNVLSVIQGDHDFEYFSNATEEGFRDNKTGIAAYTNIDGETLSVFYELDDNEMTVTVSESGKEVIFHSDTPPLRYNSNDQPPVPELYVSFQTAKDLIIVLDVATRLAALLQDIVKYEEASSKYEDAN